MTDRKYYEAYDDRYRQVHAENLQWFSEKPSGIVAQVIGKYGVSKTAPMLEIGCGEGRDARPLLKEGFNLLATDISPEAIAYCQKQDPAHKDSYRVLDCIGGQTEETFAFIYAVAVLHMLVEDADRAAFYRFIREHLTDDGVALICTMGDGTIERQSDVSTAFDLQQRIHEESGKSLLLAGTSCRMVCFSTFEAELTENDLEILEKGFSPAEPDFNNMMYAVVKRRS
ncbi:MAG: class I SAM-dependent methyltransferase [Clostridia bacterium]|nr:class I SAM-dependent methyltransferase [Clostridia bacterium]